MKTALDYRDVGHDYALCCSDDKHISEEREVAGSIPNIHVTITSLLTPHNY